MDTHTTNLTYFERSANEINDLLVEFLTRHDAVNMEGFAVF